MIIPFIIVMFLLTFFTAGGVSMLTAGELPGLPFAVGGAIAQFAILTLIVAVLQVRLTLAGDTISATALAAASRTARLIRRIVLVAIVGLFIYGLVRVVLGDPWTLLAAALVSVVLGTVAVGAQRLGTRYQARLSASA
jgi:hypothetical protein